METIAVKSREVKGTNANRRLRREGSIPANVYGKGMDAQSIAVNSMEFLKILNNSGMHNVFSLAIPKNKPVNVIIKDIQMAPVNRELLHVDFQQVMLNEEIHAEVAVKIIGSESLDSNLIIVRQTDSLSVRALPQEIPDSIEVDVSNLHEGDSIKLGDIGLPKGINVDNELDQVLVSLTVAKINESVEEDESTSEDSVIDVDKENDVADE